MQACGACLLHSATIYQARVSEIEVLAVTQGPGMGTSADCKRIHGDSLSLCGLAGASPKPKPSTLIIVRGRSQLHGLAASRRPDRDFIVTAPTTYSCCCCCRYSYFCSYSYLCVLCHFYLFMEAALPRILGRPLGYLIFPLMALMGDPIYQYFSMGFKGQPRIGP